VQYNILRDKVDDATAKITLQWLLVEVLSDYHPVDRASA